MAIFASALEIVVIENTPYKWLKVIVFILWASFFALTLEAYE